MNSYSREKRGDLFTGLPASTTISVRNNTLLRMKSRLWMETPCYCYLNKFTIGADCGNISSINEWAVGQQTTCQRAIAGVTLIAISFINSKRLAVAGCFCASGFLMGQCLSSEEQPQSMMPPITEIIAVVDELFEASNDKTSITSADVCREVESHLDLQSSLPASISRDRG